MPAGQRTRHDIQRAQRRLDNVRHLGKPAGAFLAAGHIAVGGPCRRDPASPEPRQIFLCRRMPPHRVIHRRRHHHRRGGRQQDGRRQVIGKPARGARDQVRGCRHDQHEIRLAGKSDMTHLGLVGQREQLGKDFLAGQRRQAQRSDEFACGPGHDSGHADIVVLKAPRHFQRLVGGDAATDHKKHPFPAEQCAGQVRNGAFARDRKACRINLVAAGAKGLADRAVRPPRQRALCQIVADGAWPDAKKLLQRLPPAKCGDDCRKIRNIHSNLTP